MLEESLLPERPKRFACNAAGKLNFLFCALGGTPKFDNFAGKTSTTLLLRTETLSNNLTPPISLVLDNIGSSDDFSEMVGVDLAVKHPFWDDSETGFRKLTDPFSVDVSCNDCGATMVTAATVVTLLAINWTKDEN